MGASPGAAVALTRMNAEIDIRGVLPSIQVPTLVLHRAGDRCLRVEEGQYLASHIRGATFVKLEGEDHLPFVGDQDAILNEIQGFITRTHAPHRAGPVLASIVTIRSDASGEDLAQLRRVFERELAWGRGSQVAATSGDLVAAFDGPGRAIRCAAAVVTAGGSSGITASAGVHVGECDLSNGRGPILDVAARLARAAGRGEVYVSRTIVDLVHGSGLEFVDCGVLTAQGLGRELPMMKVASA
jgi:hypothetical protein